VPQKCAVNSMAVSKMPQNKINLTRGVSADIKRVSACNPANLLSKTVYCKCLINQEKRHDLQRYLKFKIFGGPFLGHILDFQACARGRGSRTSEDP